VRAPINHQGPLNAAIMAALFRQKDLDGIVIERYGEPPSGPVTVPIAQGHCDLYRERAQEPASRPTTACELFNVRYRVLGPDERDLFSRKVAERENGVASPEGTMYGNRFIALQVSLRCAGLGVLRPWVLVLE
jgi:hypothetical protein